MDILRYVDARGRHGETITHVQLCTGGKGGVGECPEPRIVVRYHQRFGRQARRPRPVH